MNAHTFYDMHIHAFNLSHPSLLAFIRRALRELASKLIRLRRLPASLLALALGVVLFVPWFVLVLASFVPGVGRVVRRGIKALTRLAKRLLKTAFNLLSVMENDIGSTFLLMENCLREEENPLLRGDELCIGGMTYTHIVLTPLMMDFGYKGKSAPSHGRPRFHYDIPAGKPIVEQVIDVFGAIKTYVDTESTDQLSAKYPALRRGTRRIFEIYPFLGINPKNYKFSEIVSLLDKYFSAYTGKRDDLRANIGRFDGSIDHLECNFFAGIKVYPPLGFDPWPRDEAELEKVRELYRCARDNGIPMTTHGGRGGFKGVGRTELNECTAVSKWAAVLAEFPTLKLNLAHFPMNLSERRRRDKTLQLVLDRDSVYVDVSCRATNATYYTELRRLLDRLSDEEREKLRSRILFGSDFAVNLLRIESYNQYVSIFSRTDALTPDEKRAFCSGNPERFLFTHAE